MITVAVMMFVGFLVVVVVGLAVARSATLDHEQTRARLRESGADTLVFDVPQGQDSVGVLVALAQAGFTSVEDTVGGTRHVLVECPHGIAVDRSRVRAVIEQACFPAGLARAGAHVDHVRFADER
jgi:hypothetical protein